MDSQLENVRKLLELQVGDKGRLEELQQRLENHKILFTSDRGYLETLVQQHLSDRISPTTKIKENIVTEPEPIKSEQKLDPEELVIDKPEEPKIESPSEEKSGEVMDKPLQSEEESKKSKFSLKRKKKEPKQNEPSNEETEDTTQQNDSELTEIKQLRKEIHKLQNRNHRIEEHLRNSGEIRTRASSFGRGVLGVFLLLFGLGMILLLAHHFENIDNSMRGMYYGGDPWAVVINMFVVIPAILLLIGGFCMYYGIRIISKT